MITVIGLEKLAKTFGLSINHIAQELGIGRQTVYDWLKGKRKIPKERVEQLSKIPEFTHVTKDLFQKEIDETDELEIELAYFQHLSAKHSEEIVDEDDIPITLDPYYQHRVALEELKEREKELQRTKSLLQDDSYLEELDSFANETYLHSLAALNGTFKQNNATKIKVVTDLLILVNMNDITEGFSKDLKELLQKHDMYAGDDDWMKLIMDSDE